MGRSAHWLVLRDSGNSVVTLRVVLTGGIACGKSAVSAEFAALGVTVLDTDQINRDVVAAGSESLAKIVDAFGSGVLDSNGRLDRGKMRERVFSDPEQRRRLEAITHPAIRQELSRRSAAAAGIYQIHAIPLFVETGAKGGYDRVLVVDCPEELQVARLVKRDGSDPALARKILAAQTSRSARLDLADDVIVNDGTLDELRGKVTTLHQRYLALAEKKFPARLP
jgi:dephospho-CoA kinase